MGFKKLNKEKIELYYYFGEFGFFNLEILGGLEEYFNKNPEKKIKVITYNNYSDILKSRFPENIETVSLDWISDKKGSFRVSHVYVCDDKEIKKIEKKGVNLSSLTTKIDRKNLGYKFLDYKYLSSPLKFGKESKIKKYISLFPRKRYIADSRNIGEKLGNEIIKALQKGYPEKKIVIHGAGDEFTHFDGNNLIYPKNSLEQIYYLNNSVCCVCPDSGFAHFSLNCGCDTLVLGKTYRAFGYFNPFKKKLRIVSFKKFKVEEIKKFIEGKSQPGLLEKIGDVIIINYWKIRIKFRASLRKLFPKGYVYIKKILMKDEKT